MTCFHAVSRFDPHRPYQTSTNKRLYLRDGTKGRDSPYFWNGHDQRTLAQIVERGDCTECAAFKPRHAGVLGDLYADVRRGCACSFAVLLPPALRPLR